jgi:hypothetical protein
VEKGVLLDKKFMTCTARVHKREENTSETECAWHIRGPITKIDQLSLYRIFAIFDNDNHQFCFQFLGFPGFDDDNHQFCFQFVGFPGFDEGIIN